MKQMHICITKYKNAKYISLLHAQLTFSKLFYNTGLQSMKSENQYYVYEIWQYEPLNKRAIWEEK